MEKHSKMEFKNKYINFQKKSKNFEFTPRINSLEEYKENYNSKLLIKHLDCDRTFEMTIKEWQNLSVSNKILKDESYVCILCR